MTNEELKKKICEIIAPYVSAWGEDERIADALIDVLKDEQQSMNGILTNMSSYMNYKLHELEHRAEIAERALYLLSKSVHEFYMKTKFVGDYFVNDPKMICTKFLKQAEKELAEEGEDG